MAGRTGWSSLPVGKVKRVSQPYAPGGADVETDYTYNPRGRLVTVTMTRGGVTQTRTFSYDWHTDRLLSVTAPESGTVSCTYHADGTVASKTDAESQKV